MAWTLCSKEDVIDFHPVTATELKDSWSVLVEGLIREHINWLRLGLSELVVTAEELSGNGTAYLYPKQRPLVSVQSLVVNGRALDSAAYAVFPGYVQLRGEHVFPQGNLNVVISYTAGPGTVPDEVRLAAVSMIIAALNYKKRQGADASLRWSSAETKAGEENPNTQIGFSSHLVQIMKRILKRNRVRGR